MRTPSGINRIVMSLLLLLTAKQAASGGSWSVTVSNQFSPSVFRYQSSTEHTVDWNYEYGTWSHPCDVDGDLDVDIVGVAWYSDNVAWWENDGSGGGWTKHVIDDDFDGAVFVTSFDVENDGDTDILASVDRSDGELGIHFWRNNGNGTGWTQTGALPGSGFLVVHCVHACDLARVSYLRESVARK